MLGVELCLSANAVLLGFDACFGKLDHALRVALDSHQVSLGLRERGLRCGQASLCVHDAAVGFAEGLGFGGASGRNLRIVGVDGRLGSVFLSLEVGGVNLGDQ